MTLYEFNALTVEQRINCCWERGVFLLSRPAEPFNPALSQLSLYAVANFFVEIHYANGQNSITDCRAFSSVVPLDPYLDTLDLRIWFAG